jgi:hypothetical protein
MTTFPAVRRAVAIQAHVRTLHTFIGMLTAPTIIFFAVTGILQIYHLDVARLGYTPPAIFEKLSQVHKNQVYAPRRRRPQVEQPGEGPADAPGLNAAALLKVRSASVATLLLKLQFTIAAAGLIFSISLGLWMALRPGSRRKINLLLLVAGILIPVVLAALTV